MAYLFIFYGKVKDRSFYIAISLFDILYYLILPFIYLFLILDELKYGLIFVPHVVCGLMSLVLFVTFFCKNDGEFPTHIFYSFVRTLLNYYVFLGSLVCIILRFAHGAKIYHQIFWICIGSVLFEAALNLYWSYELKEVLERFEMSLWNVRVKNSDNLHSLLT